MAAPSWILQSQQEGVTIFLICLNILIWFYLWNGRHDVSHLSLSYSSLVDHKQYYRILTSAFTHVSFFHIAMNMVSVWTLGVLEIYLSSLIFLTHVICIIWIEGIVLLIIVYIADKYLGYHTWRDKSGIGFSGVLFGLLSIEAMIDPTQMVSVFGLFSIPFILYPIVMVILIQIVIPNVSLIGHLSGMISGFILSTQILFDTPPVLSIILLVWTIVFAIWNAHKTADGWALPEWLIKKEEEIVGSGVTIINGNIVSRSINDERRALV